MILLSSWGMLSLANRSRRSNRSRIETRQSRWRLRSSRTPSSQALASSSSSACPDERCLAVECKPSFSSGTSFVSMAYESCDASAALTSAPEKRKYSCARPSLRLISLSISVHMLMCISALRRTPERTVSKSSGRVGGRESSRVGGKARPMNSSCTLMVACLRQTESSCGCGQRQSWLQRIDASAALMARRAWQGT